jgi:hypothetical protein
MLFILLATPFYNVSGFMMLHTYTGNKSSRTSDG